MPLFGSHLSVAGAFTNAVVQAKKLRCQSLQIFTKAPNQWRGRPITDAEAREFRSAVREAGIKRTLAHDSYLINLASAEEALYRRSVNALIEESARAEMLGLNYLVMHPGAHLGEGEEQGIARVVAGLDEVHRETAGFKLRILIENTAGQGSALGYRFEHIAQILKNVKDGKRLGVCLDTCHMFAAGYALGPIDDYRQTMATLARVIGIKHVRAFHLNDSVKERGSRVDRHAHIGRGKIGTEPFGYLVNDTRFAKLPMILETPKEDEMDKVNLRLLRRLMVARR